MLNESQKINFISNETIKAIFIIAFVGFFILVNLSAGFFWPLFVLAVVFGMAIAIKSPRSGLLSVIFLTMIFERFFTLQTFFVGREEYKIYPVDFILLGTGIGTVFFENRIKLKKPDLALLVFFILNIANFFVSVYFFKSDFSLSFSTLKNYVGYALIYFLVLSLIRNKGDLNRLFKFILAGAVGIIIFILIGIFRGEGLWSEYTPLSTSGTRILAFTHGFYLSIAIIPVLLWQILKNKNYFFYWLTLIWSLGIIGTMMRHLWLALSTALVLIYLFLSREKKSEFRKLVMGFAPPILIFVALMFFFVSLFPQTGLRSMANSTLDALSERTVSLGNINQDESYSWRKLVWNSAFSDFKKNPLIGIGTGKKIYVENGSYKDYIEVRNIHNSYLAILIQLGVAGLAGFAYFMFKILSELVRSGNTEAIYKFSVIGISSVFLFALSFQPYLEANMLSLFFWILMGAARKIPEIKS